jgi:thiol-disulfide isomerase/thioredoxin
MPDSKERDVVSRGKVLIGALLAVVLVAGLYYADRYWIAPAVKTQAKTGKNHPIAPDFSLTDLSGRKLNLSDYKGKVVLLDFWATWCGPCQIEIPWFVELQNRYGSQGLAIIGISMDDGMEPVVDFYRRYKMNYPVALGDAQLEELYGGILGLPTTFLIGRDGRIYAKHEGATGPRVFEEEIKELLAMEPTAEAQDFMPAGGARNPGNIELGDPEEVNSEVPGVNLSHLTAAQKEAFKKQLEAQHCTCPCKLNLLKCRQVDRKCQISLRLAREELDKFLKSHVPGTTNPSPTRQVPPAV